MAFHEADWIAHICEPPSEAWAAIVRLLVRYTEENGVDLFVGRKLPGLLRSAGLADIRLKPLIHVYPPGAPRCNILHDFVANLSEHAFLRTGWWKNPNSTDSSKRFGII